MTGSNVCSTSRLGSAKVYVLVTQAVGRESIKSSGIIGGAAVYIEYLLTIVRATYRNDSMDLGGLLVSLCISILCGDHTSICVKARRMQQISVDGELQLMRWSLLR